MGTLIPGTSQVWRITRRTADRSSRRRHLFAVPASVSRRATTGRHAQGRCVLHGTARIERSEERVDRSRSAREGERHARRQGARWTGFQDVHHLRDRRLRGRCRRLHSDIDNNSEVSAGAPAVTSPAPSASVETATETPVGAVATGGGGMAGDGRGITMPAWPDRGCGRVWSAPNPGPTTSGRHAARWPCRQSRGTADHRVVDHPDADAGGARKTPGDAPASPVGERHGSRESRRRSGQSPPTKKIQSPLSVIPTRWTANSRTARGAGDPPRRTSVGDADWGTSPSARRRRRPATGTASIRPSTISFTSPAVARMRGTHARNPIGHHDVLMSYRPT